MLLLSALWLPQLQAAEVIELSQTACQIVEAEPGVVQFAARSSAGCERINAKTAEERLHRAKALRLPAGDYVFRVKNIDVAYVLGFWLRGAGLSRWNLPSVSGGGIERGQSHDYAVSLQPGEYRYSCPLNPTPDYVLIVE